MNNGYITIKENDKNELIIEAKLVNCTVWMTKHEIADFLNVFVSSVGNNLRAIFKSGLLRQEVVTRTHRFEKDRHFCEMTLYNLEALIFISYRTASREAEAFREWVMKALTEYARTKPKRETDVLIVYNLSSKLHSVVFN